MQVSDSTEIEKIINEILNSNTEKVAEYRNGSTKLLGYFVGQVMKKGKGKVNPKILNQILSKKLSSN